VKRQVTSLSLAVVMLVIACILASGCVLPDPNGGGFLPVVTGPIRVMIVQDAEYDEPLSAEMVATINSEAVDKYCDTHCEKDSAGVSEFKKYMSDTATEMQSPAIRKALEVANAERIKANYRKPWITISNGKRGYSGPVPETEAELLALLKKYGGE